MSSSEYSKLLRHPEWQKMVTRVRVRADFNCEHPGCDYIYDENNNFHVHHTYYEKGKKPWEYPIESLKLLCRRHHEEVHGKTPERFAIDSDNLETLAEEAIHEHKLQRRGEKGEELYYASDQEKPYTGWSQKSEEGCIWKMCLYKDGELVLSTGWHRNKQKRFEYKEGFGMAWYDNGQKEDERTYKDGKLWTASVWKPDGEKCPVTNVVEGNGFVVEYFDDGTEWRLFEYKDGEDVNYGKL